MRHPIQLLYGLHHGIVHVFNTILYENCNLTKKILGLLIFFWKIRKNIEKRAPHAHAWARAGERASLSWPKLAQDNPS
jgi:hypothetical protein